MTDSRLLYILFSLLQALYLFCQELGTRVLGYGFFQPSGFSHPEESNGLGCPRAHFSVYDNLLKFTIQRFSI